MILRMAYLRMILCIQLQQTPFIYTLWKINIYMQFQCNVIQIIVLQQNKHLISLFVEYFSLIFSLALSISCVETFSVHSRDVVGNDCLSIEYASMTYFSFSSLFPFAHIKMYDLPAKKKNTR